MHVPTSFLCRLALLLVVSPTLPAIAAAGRVTDPRNPPKNAVHVSKISALTLHANKQTTSRRAAAIPQLTCVGPDKRVCALYTVPTLRCVNAGADYDEASVQWSCTASLPDEFMLGGTEVSCEGYASADDPFVLKGSCGVEYRLLLTAKGEERYPELGPASWSAGQARDIPALIFFTLFAAVLLFILYAFVRACMAGNLYNVNSRPGGGGGGGGRGGGGGGGGGGGNWPNDPPPPYSHSAPKPSVDFNFRPRTSRSSYSAGGGAWRPGFWTGAATGAAAGYMAGNARQRQPETQQTTRGGWGGLFGGLGGGGGSSSSSQQTAGPSSSRGQGYSSTRHESTGFGGTRRR